MKDKEKIRKILEKMPDNISIQEILEALSLVFDINSRIDNFNIDESVTTEQLLKEMKEW